MNERSKFFCEHCGAEVKQNAKVCTACGKFFTAVRCPECGQSGDAQDFAQGCPYCGYGGARRGAAAATTGTRASPGEALPLWAYALCAVAVLGLFAAFIAFGIL
ncbi:MAG: zinc ribbon domain-containing protein [Spirochaetaceae bacterium]|jgi:ssDNA-binding Zn-finger/Zn-ribbon topoisomerase 1|nr:zinc ribbon domain-containing protein [Spirochaetaceae bacterium]